ncbi:putative ABC transporter ATP-binding protein/permease [Spathaspora sp. JA1]|nr:putative ABC transporter ATP-binding protein/permease [Spathaspora sp. JA1]
MSTPNILQIPYSQKVGLSVHHLSVSVKSQIPKDIEKDQEALGELDQSHKILNDVNFELESGEIMAIMGGSGSGKTTLLNTLSQRTNITNKKLQFTGSIAYIRQNDLAHINHAYMLQDDSFLPGLTVYETLKTQADLRLPPHITQVEKLQLIDYILEVLGLVHVKNTRVSNFSTHSTVLSGGEQRRVSLAVQLLSRPSIVFLDEPTTGLDSSTSLKLVTLLKKLSWEFGMSIVVSIHQPRSEIVELFDKICLLTRGGRMVYYGDVTHAKTYFDNIDFLEGSSTDYFNHIEYIMGLSVKDTTSQERELQTIARIDKLVKMWKEKYQLEANPNDELQQFESFEDNLKLFTRGKSDRISFLRELIVLTKRTFVLSYRDVQGLLVLNLGAIIISVAIGWMFFQPAHDLAGIRSITSTLYVILEVVAFCPMYIEVERLWLTDGIFFYREYSENWVSIPGFIISRRLGKFLIEDLPMSISFAVITYFMWGLGLSNGSNFGIYFAIVLILELCCMASSLLCFTIAPSFAITAVAINIFYQVQNSACGYFVNAATMPVYVRWTKYIAYFWYAFGALTVNQFSDWNGDCPFSENDPRCFSYTGEYQLQILGFPNGWIGEPIGILICWIVGFLLFSGVAISFKRFDVGVAKTRENRYEVEEEHHDIEIHHTRDEDIQQKTTTSPPTPDKDINDYFQINIENIHLSAKKTRFHTHAKCILDGISATFSPNSVNVIMGPSGSGKTTLLNYLSNRLPKSSTYIKQGVIKFNKQQIITQEELGKVGAYVTQHDTSLIHNLTVRETLYYQARIRLPLKDHKNIHAIINRLIRQTGLVDCADTIIGSEYVKGISGGEKRRVSIAIQLLSRPKVLFLDEPTSGLDSFTAEMIYSLLETLAKENGTTVILTIHQPSYEMFCMFGSLLLLGYGGKVIYQGASMGIVQYLEHLGYQMNNDTNIADFVLDLISQKVQEEGSTSSYLSSNWNQKQEKSITSCCSCDDLDIKQYYNQRLPFRVTFRTIVERQILTSYRAKDVVFSRAGQTFFLGIVHTLYFAPLRNTQDGISNRLGLVQEVLNLYFVGLVNNISLYPFERNLFYQEYKDGVYGVSEFGISYLINELPTEIIPSLFFSALIVFACGLPRTAEMYFAMFGTAVISINCGESLGIFVNSCFNHLGVATNVLTVVVMMAIFMGGTMSLHMPMFFKVFNYISPMKYAVAICANLGFTGQVFKCSEGMEECVFNSGEAVLDYYNLRAHLGAMIGGLIACLVVYRSFAIAPSVDAHVKSIQITGSFDNWARSIPPKTDLSKGYTQEIVTDEKQNIIFKFVLNDSDWITNDQFKIQHDESGNSNNVIEADELIEVSVPVSEPINKTEEPEVVQNKAEIEEKAVSEEVVQPPVGQKEVTAPIEQFEEDKDYSPENEINASAVIVSEEDPVQVETPELSIQSPIITSEDEIISDIDDKSTSPVSSPQPAQQQSLSQILTSSSSFAAVSLPPSSSDQDYEHLQGEEVEEEFNTPTNSLGNSSVLKPNDEFTLSSNQATATTATTATTAGSANIDKPVKPVLLSQPSESTIEVSEENIIKIPGGYPASPEPKTTASVSPRKEAGKRENLISRFKSLFR